VKTRTLLSVMACVLCGAAQADNLALPAKLTNKATVLGPADPDYGRAVINSAVKPAGQGGVSAGLVIRTTQDMPVYRMWSGPDQKDDNGNTNRLGGWWSYDAPTGPVSAYRKNYEICKAWNELLWVETCTLKAGAVVAIGPGQSVSAETCGDPAGQEQYPADTRDWQTYVDKPWTRSAELQCPSQDSDYLANPNNIAVAVAPAELAKQAKANYQATRDYYAKLITGDEPRLAELNLLMTMLPKGGDIHHHYTGAIYVETYLDWVDQQSYCIDSTTFRINTTPGAASKTCLSAASIRADDNLYRQLLSLWSDKDFADHYAVEPPPDKQFFDTFGYFGPVDGTAPNDGLKLLKRRAIADQMQYLETMLQGAPFIDNPQLAAAIDALPPDANGPALEQALAPFADFVAQDPGAQATVNDYRARLKAYADGLDDDDFTVRFQTYVSRNSAPSKVFSGLCAAFAAAHDNPLIVGVNIVGPENGVVAMRDYTLHMRMFQFLKKRYPEVRLDLHAGELTLGMVPPEGLRNHIRQAVEIAGAERIGHGIDVSYETAPDTLLALLKSRQVAVEINLSSNAFILGVAGAAHPVTIYQRQGVPIVISTDDAGVSRSSIGGEYLMFTSRYKPSYDTLKQVVYNSIRYSFLSNGDKAIQIQRLDRRFSKFEADVARLARAAAP
jgi:adenosine deaminase